MRKWTVEFLRKFKNRGTKIAGVISILIIKAINLQLFTLISYGVGVLCDRRLISVLSPFIVKSMVHHFDLWSFYFSLLLAMLLSYQFIVI